MPYLGLNQAQALFRATLKQANAIRARARARVTVDKVDSVDRVDKVEEFES